MLINFLVLLIANTCAREWRYRDGKVLVLALDEAFSLEEEIALDARQSDNQSRGRKPNTLGAQRMRRGRQKPLIPAVFL